MRRECLVLWISANNLLAEASNDIVNGKVWASPAAKVEDRPRTQRKHAGQPWGAGVVDPRCP
jgi:hypothetical protein